MALAQSAGATVCLSANRHKAVAHDLENAYHRVTRPVVRSPGGRQLTVRLPLVKKALDHFKRIADGFEASKPTQKMRHPFTSLDFELRDLNAWRIRRDVKPYLRVEDFNCIVKLRPGEYWALAILSTRQEPEEPENKLDAAI